INAGGKSLMAAISRSSAGAVRAGQDTAIGKATGVSSLTKTNNHRLCAKAGQRPRRDTAAAGRVSSEATRALPRPISTSECIVGLRFLASALLFLCRRFRRFDELQQLAQLLCADPFGPDQVGQEGLQRATAQFFGQRFELPADRFIPAKDRPKFISGDA